VPLYPRATACNGHTMELVRTSSTEMRRRRLKLERHTARIELHTAELDVELQELRGEMQALMESAADALSLDGPELEELFGLRPAVFEPGARAQSPGSPAAPPPGGQRPLPGGATRGTTFKPRKHGWSWR
jgi:hypothetical protein